MTEFFVPQSVRISVQGVIRKYGLFREKEPVGVAFSGGKDSVLLARALAQLNYRVVPIAVDLGYGDQWTREVLQVAEQIELDAQIVHAHEVSTPPVAVEIQRRLGSLSRLERNTEFEFTPCTDCYNIKALCLGAAAETAGIRRVAFAHHRTDAEASFLKSALMYIDRWDVGNEVYSSSSFRELVRQVESESSLWGTPNAKTPLLDRIRQLAASGAADTDEPPRQPLHASTSVEVVRPLFDVSEKTIVATVAASHLNLQPSGCAHTFAPSRRTPREIVHLELLRSSQSNELHVVLNRLIRLGLTPSGESKFRSRKNRSRLLGATYKPGFGNSQKL